jgi:hypothetical protein
MLASFRHGGFSRPKQLTSIERVEKNAAARARERAAASPSGRRAVPDPVASLRRLGQDMRTVATYRRAQKKQAIKRRRVRLAQRATEELQFKKWVRFRNPNLNRKIDRENARQKVLREWFGFLDDDGSGEISRDEIGGPLISLGLAKNMREVDKLIASVDQDGSGDIDFDEFEAMLVNGKGGPIQELLRTIADGSLGDPRVSSVKSLMTTARRRRIVDTMHGYGKVKPGDRRYGMIGVPDDVVFNRRLMSELQSMAEATARLGVEREVHEASLVAAERDAVAVGALDPEKVQQHEHDLSAAMHAMASGAVTGGNRLPTLPRRRFPRHHSRVQVLVRGGFVSGRGGDGGEGREKKETKITSLMMAKTKAKTQKQAPTTSKTRLGFPKKKPGILASTL